MERKVRVPTSVHAPVHGPITLTVNGLYTTVSKICLEINVTLANLEKVMEGRNGLKNLENLLPETPYINRIYCNSSFKVENRGVDRRGYAYLSLHLT